MRDQEERLAAALAAAARLGVPAKAIDQDLLSAEVAGIAAVCEALWAVPLAQPLSGWRRAPARV